LSVARRVGAKRTLLIHFSHDISHRAVSAQLPPGVELAFDGLAVALTGL
ncbi:MAG: MBL fold metallo-hydrolase, partial [Planctomycetota bacterium]